MSFLDPSERLIVFDFGGSNMANLPANLFLPAELKDLASIGIQTIYYQGAFQWDVMQPEPGNPIDWSGIDGYVDNIEAAGLRALLPFVYNAPVWKGAGWFQNWKPGGMASAPNYTNPAVAIELDDLLMTAIWRYSGRPVQFIYSIPIDGEFPFTTMDNRSEPDFPSEKFVEWVVNRQLQFAEQYNEVWTAFHLIDQPTWADAMYSALRGVFPEAAHYAMQFTHWHHDQPAIDIVDRIHRTYGVRYFAGADYCTGLRRNTPKAIEHECGLVCAPIGLHSGGGRLDGFLLGELAWSVQEFSDNVPA